MKEGHKKTSLFSNKNQFDFCKVCKLNHNQGRKHIYFPNHIKSLGLFLSKFQKKISDLRFFIKNPLILQHELAPQNRFYCAFCEIDISESSGTFACFNSIHHLSDSEHLKNLKEFLWKHGGGMDRVDAFRVSETDFIKWEKNCRLLKAESSSTNGKLYEPLPGPKKDIHHELNPDNVDSFIKKSNHSFKFKFSTGILPLQNFTNEKHQVHHPQYSPTDSGGDVSMQNASNTKKYLTDIQYDVNGNDLIGGWVHQLQVKGNEGSSKEPITNVHTGAPPPWLDANEDNEINNLVKKGSWTKSVSQSDQSKRSRKLNPKRVGAVWAEKEKSSLKWKKMESSLRTMVIPNWLPNFGRVWQSGTRKESRKEFEKEKHEICNVDSVSQASVKIDPYISKRLRRDVLSTGEEIHDHLCSR